MSDDQRPRRGLTVQAEAADEVLQDRAFRFPLLWGTGTNTQTNKKDGQMCQGALVSIHSS